MALTEAESMAIEDEGYAAFQRGETPRHNPYPWRDNERCLAWIAGHAMARTDYRIRCGDDFADEPD